MIGRFEGLEPGAPTSAVLAEAVDRQRYPARATRWNAVVMASAEKGLVTISPGGLQGLHSAGDAVTKSRGLTRAADESDGHTFQHSESN